MSDALKYKEENSLRKKIGVSNDNYKQYEICVENHELGKYGIGIQLYFSFLKKCSFVFLIMFLASTPAIYSNLTGNSVL